MDLDEIELKTTRKMNGADKTDYKKESEQWKQMYLDEVDKHVDIILLYNKLLKENKELKAKLEFKQFGDLDNIRFEEYMNEFVPKQKIKDKIEELNRKEQELQNSITEEEREEYSDANISFQLCDIEIRREVLQELLKGEDK